MDAVPSLRLFVALPLPAELVTQLIAVQRELRDVLPPHSTAWVKPINLHLTLRFLGDVNAARVPELEQNLRAGLCAQGELNLVCERLGCFPDLRFPRVVWAWVHAADEQLNHLVQAVETAVAPFAEKPADARFVGHVTLARPKQIRRADAERLARFVEGAATRRFGEWRAGVVELIQSRLGPGGSEYTTLATLNLLPDLR